MSISYYSLVDWNTEHFETRNSSRKCVKGRWIMRTGYVVNCVQNNVIEDSGIVMMEPNCSLSCGFGGGNR